MLALKMDCYSSRTLYISKLVRFLQNAHLLYYYNNLYIGTMQIIIFRRTFPPFNKKKHKKRPKSP